MLDLLPQSFLSLEYDWKMKLHTESIVPKGMLDSSVHIAEKSKLVFRAGGRVGEETTEIISQL